MKKKLFFLSIAASFVLLATSCKKGEDAAPTAQGYWEGKSGTGQNAPNNFYAILVLLNNNLT